MSRSIRTLSIAVLAALPLGCTTSEPPPRQRPPADEGVYRRPPAYVEPPPGSVAKDIPLYDYGRREPANSPPSQPPADDGRPLVDTTGVKLGELASVRAATMRPQHWQVVLPPIEDRIDAPDLKANARNGLAALAPRVARALIDFKGETAIVTIAVYRDPSPATRPAAPATAPSTNPAAAPATQPVYKHAAVAIAFEGFAGQLDPSFIPRVLADQPRTPDDGREPIDFNLMLDREASSYVFYQLSRDGLMAGQVSHADLRRDLADAVDKVQPSTRPSTGQAAPAADSVAGIYEPVPAPGGVRYDTGEVWTTQRYGDYVYRGPDYYWGSGADPYLYDLYGCRWGSPYWVTRSGYYYNDYYYGRGFWYGSGYYGYYGGHGHHHDDDDHHNGNNNNNNGNGRPPVVVSDRSPRGKVPWGNAPIVSATNPPASANNGPTPLVIAAQPSGTPVRPAPTITGRPMKAPKEFVGPRSVGSSGGSAGTPSAASFRTADGSVLVVPSKSSQAQSVDSSSGDDGGSKAPIIVPARRSSPAYVAPSGTYTPPPAQRPSARGSTPSERINSAPRLGPSSNGNREFVGPRSNPGGDSGGGRSITGGNSGGGRSGGGDGGGSGGGGKSSGGGDGGGRSGGGGGGGGGNSGGGKGDGGGRNR